MPRWMTIKEYDKAISDALARVRSMDAIDRTFGHATPAELPFYQQLRTVSLALRAGIEADSQECLTEAQVMLDHVLATWPDAPGIWRRC